LPNLNLRFMSDRITQIKALLYTDAKDVFLNYTLGLEYRATGEREQALVQFKLVTKLDPYYVPGWHQFAIESADQGLTQQAIDCAQEGLRKAEQQGNMKTHGELKELINALQEE